MVPTVEFPPVTPSTRQVTAVFEVFSTVAVNACVPPPALTLAVLGDTVTVMSGDGVVTRTSAESCAPSTVGHGQPQLDDPVVRRA